MRGRVRAVREPLRVPGLGRAVHVEAQHAGHVPRRRMRHPPPVLQDGVHGQVAEAAAEN